MRPTFLLAFASAAALLALQACTSTSNNSNDQVFQPPDLPASTAPPTTGFRDRVPILPDEPFSYELALPAHFANVVPLDDTPAGSPMTDAGATLGRVLFYDVNLGADRAIRCSSCHIQDRNFTDPFLLSQGVAGRRTRRHSMSLANVRFNGSGKYFWDQRAPSLEAQMREAIMSQTEMAMPPEAVRQRINERRFYGPLFTDAFGDGEVTDERIDSALAQFVRSMVSAEARYDEGRAQVGGPLESFPNFSDQENRGKEIFFNDISNGGGSCSNCHVTEAQLTDPEGISNNGLSLEDVNVFGSPDLGGFEATGDPAELGAFRIPSLRNIEVSGPYMHDGRVESLEAVVQHYSAGIQPHPNLSPLLRNADGSPVRMDFTPDEAEALVAFLKTLTDETFLNDDRFSDPFRFQAASPEG